MMLETFFGWLAIVALVALPFTHPVRAKSYGPRLIALLIGVGTTSLGLYLLFFVHDLFSRGLIPSLRGGTLVISEHPAYALVVITALILYSVASLVAGVYFGKLGFRRKKEI